MRKSTAALQEYSDPLLLNVGQLLEELNTVQNKIRREGDIFEVIQALSSLTNLREKQDTHIRQLLRGNMEILDRLLFQTFYKLLHRPMDLHALGQIILQKNGSYKQSAVKKHYIEQDQLAGEKVTDFYIPILEKITWSRPKDEEQLKDSDLQVKHFTKVFTIKAEEKLQWKEELELLFETLQEGENICIREWVIQQTYQESMKRLQAIGYFIASGKVELQEDTTIIDALERYQIRKSPLGKKRSTIHTLGESIIFTLTHQTWKEYYRNRNN